VLFSEESKRAGIAAVRAAADRVNKPTAQVRELVESIQEAIPAFGMESLLPGFYEGGLDPLAAWLPSDAVVLVDDPVAIDRALEELWTGLEQGHDATVARGELALPPEQHCLRQEETWAQLGAFARADFHG